MDIDLSALGARFATFVQPLLDYVAHPAFVAQLVLIAVLFPVARYIDRRVEPYLEARARRIKGQPHILRVIIALMRRADWIAYVLLLLLSLAILRAVAPPEASYLVSIALALAAAWLIVSVASRAIRNKFAARFVQWLAWLYAALVIIGIEDRAADFLDRISIRLGTFDLSVLLVVKAVLIVSLAIWVAVTIGNFVDARLRRSADLTPSFGVLIGKLTKIALVVVAGAIALSAVGVDLTAFTIFSGAIGVGIGFGLQKVVSNFVSGVIILLDKSIKPGDTISLGDTFGWIRDLRARFVSVVTREGKEYLIPNEDFITQRVINWSFTDDLVRLDVAFRVAFDSNPHDVVEIAIKAAMSVDRVERARLPVCWMTGFGEYSLDFVLRFWIDDPQSGLASVRGLVLLALWDALKEAGIGIPYPQREILFRNPPPLPAKEEPDA